MKHIDNPQELPGFKKKSFSMFFNGGEIWFEHLDGIYGFEDLAIEKLLEDSIKFSRPSGTSLICFNLDETEITRKIISEIVDKLIFTNKKFTRVCFVGVNKQVEKILKKALSDRNFALSFNKDFEKAKEWLVSENYL